MFFRDASSGWLLRLWLSVAFVLLSAENCSTPNRNLGGVNTGDPTEGKFVLGRAFKSAGGAYASSDGRTFDYSLVQSTNAKGIVTHYITNDELGKRNATSVTVAPPNAPFRFIYPMNGEPATVVVLTTTSSTLPFESAKNNLTGSGSVVRYHVKTDGKNGLGSVLLSSLNSATEELKLVNVSLKESVEVQSPPLYAGESLVNGLTRYLTAYEKGMPCYFMQLTSALVGEFGEIDPSGMESSQSGRLYQSSPNE